MKIAIEISPLANKSNSLHAVRGSGFYIAHLQKALQEFFPQYHYFFFNKTEQLPHDINLLHIPYFEPFFFCLPFQKKHKTIVTVHDLTPIIFKEHFPSGLRGTLIWNIQKFLLKNMDAIITDSKCSKKDIHKLTGISDNKIHVVSLAADSVFGLMSATQKQALRNKYNLPSKFVLYVGDITWNKNLPRVIDAVNTLQVPLVLVGKAITEEGYDRQNPWNKDRVYIQEKIAESKTIQAVGFVSTEDLVGIYNLATVFVMPSLYEGFGLPILEAMACGCPVVTSREGSLPEIAGEAASYVDASDTEDIKRGIWEVFHNEKLRQTLSKKGLEHAKQFSWKKTAGDTIGIYKKIVSSS